MCKEPDYGRLPERPKRTWLDRFLAFVLWFDLIVGLQNTVDFCFNPSWKNLFHASWAFMWFYATLLAARYMVWNRK